MRYTGLVLMVLMAAIAAPLGGQDVADPFFAMALDDLKAEVEHGPPGMIYMLAWRLLQEGTIEEAAFYYYLAHARYRYYRAALVDEVSFDERTATNAMASAIGEAVNLLIGSSTRKWKAAVDAVIAHVATHDYLYCPRSISEEAYQEAMQELQEMSDYIRDHEGEIRTVRERNGLTNELE